MSILLDAGPSLNFLAVGQENVLIQVAASQQLQIAAPKRVDTEILGMCQNPRFSRTKARTTWATLKSTGRVEILSDELATQRFADAVGRISGLPATQRVRDKKSLGEIMVLAHASVYAQNGQHVFVLMDDGDAVRRARREYEWLTRQNAPAGIEVWSTRRVLRTAGSQPGWIRGGHAWETVYAEMRKFDDGLPPLK